MKLRDIPIQKKIKQRLSLFRMLTLGRVSRALSVQMAVSKHVELANQVTEDDRAVAGHRTERLP
jgi:hypothetical protein